MPFTTFGLDLENTITYRDREPFDVGPFRITPFLTDHSAFDAYSLLIEAEGRKIFYTGDFRGHGRKQAVFKRLLAEPVIKGVDVMLMEGTHLSRERDADSQTEYSLEDDITQSISNTTGLVLASFSAQNIDRFVTFWKATRRAGRTFVADAYLAYRYFEAQKQIMQADTVSRIESSRLTAIANEQGFYSQSEVALARASAAEGNKSVLQQTAQSERAIKSLVAMTAIEEPVLRQLLNPASDQSAKLPSPAKFTIDSLPANVLLQRPDVAAAERDVAEASANIGVQRAKQYPKLSLSGNITPTLQNINGGALLLAQTWAIGPTLSLPLFDSGKRAADVEAAKAKYQAASSRFHSKVRTAVKEVEEALVRLNSADKILPESQLAVEGYNTHFKAVQTLYQIGLGNLLNVEVARRQRLAAELAVKELEREQVSAWIALYRAAGGNWSEDQNNDTNNGKKS